jgi:glucose uptake protein GlcU
MRTLFGMILGCLFTIGGVYIYDSMNTSRVSNGSSVTAGRTIVNWDVAATDWDLLKTRTREKWVQLSSN